MLDVTASGKPAAPKTVTTKHLAYELAEQHQLSKKQSLEMMEELDRHDHQTPEEGRAREDRRARNFGGA